MKRLLSRLFARIAMALGIAALFAVPAQAEREPSYNSAYWNVVNAGACSLILNSGALYLSPDGRSVEGEADWPAKITWNGPCGANGLANGRGTMTVAVAFYEGNFSTDYRSAYTGEMRDGVMTGTFSTQSTNNDGKGNYTSNYPAENYTYTNGCDTEWDFDHECKFADAQALQKRFGAGGSGAGAGAGTGAGAGAGAGAGTSYAGGTTYTTVGGNPIAPPKFAAPQETALGNVTDGLLSTLGGRSGIGFSTGDVTIDAIIASLQVNLGLNGNAALGGRGDLLSLVLGEVRKALRGANPASTNGQVADLVMNTVRVAAAGKGAAGPAPVVKPPAPVIAPPAPVVAARSTAATQNTRSTGGGAPAALKMVTAAIPRSVMDYIAGKGDSVNLSADTDGKPLLTEADNHYQIYFYDCGDAKDQCQTLQFTACFSNYPRANVTKANEWNAGYIKVKTYIDSNGWVCVDSVVPTGVAGVSYDAMDLSFDAFLWFRENAEAQFK